MLREGHHAGHVTALPGNERLQGRRCTPQERAIGGRGLLLHVLPDILKLGLRGIDMSREVQRPGVGQREQRPGMHDRFWQRTQPAQQRPHLATQEGRLRDLLDQARRLLHVARGQGVLNRLGDQPLLHVPGCGPAVQEPAAAPAGAAGRGCAASRRRGGDSDTSAAPSRAEQGTDLAPLQQLQRIG